MNTPKVLNTTALVLAVTGLCVVSYFGALSNFFISDDFTLLPFVKTLDQHPLYIWEKPSEFFRSLSYVYFWLCLRLFGTDPKLFYAAGIALHAVVSLLVYGLVDRISKRRLAAWAAALFFAAYGRHEEAVMWISAANELILALSFLAFLLLWEKVAAEVQIRRRTYVVALAAFALALMSKETAVVLVPLALLRCRNYGCSLADTIRKTAPLFLVAAGWIGLWLYRAHLNFFVADQHYEFGPHFFTVYAWSLARLSAALIPFLIVFLVLRRQSHGEWDWKKPLLFFAVFLPLSVVPLSFLTYSNYLPSRNMYVPSIAVAAMIGILFSALYDRSRSTGFRFTFVVLFSVCLVSNIADIWLKHGPQYAKRAAPTTELLRALGELTADRTMAGGIHVCGFPLHPSIGDGAVNGFTSLSPGNVVFACDETGSVVMTWQADRQLYETRSLSALTE